MGQQAPAVLDGEQASHKGVTVTDQHPGEKACDSREAILAIIERAAVDTSFMAEILDDPEQALQGYRLTSEEKTAITSGDIRRIEEWLGELKPTDRKWLWKRLRQETL